MDETLDFGNEVEVGVDSGVKMGSPKGGNGSGSVKRESGGRGEIDTSVPFESVKEAASRFGGIGFWKPIHCRLPEAEPGIEEVDVAQVEEQAAQLEKDLILKEREALGVLKELEATKMIVEELKVKLQKESSEVTAILEANSDDRTVIPIVQEAEMTTHENPEEDQQHLAGGLMLCPSSAPGLILMELKQAKLNLTRTTNDLADIRASVELFNKKIEKERTSLEKTRERLSLNSSKISSLEAELNQTRLKVQLAKNAEIKGSFENPMDVTRELRRLSSEAEDFKKMGEAAKSEVLRAISEIEQTKSRIKTAEIRLVAAKKMKEAARAAEVVALAEIKALSNSESSQGAFLQKPDAVTLSFEEYSALTCRAREAEELSKRRVIDAMLQVDEANLSKVEILKRVEDATEEVKTSKRALKEALNRVEAANRGKLAVEEALRKWRSDHGQKRRSSVHNSTKFKNSYPSHHLRDSRLRDVNGLNLISDGPNPVLKPTLSIGQILSRKLMMPDEFEPGIHKDNNNNNNNNNNKKSNVKQKMSLGQMLNKQGGDPPSHCKAERESVPKQFPAKRKKFGFGRFSLLLANQSKKKKRPTTNSRRHGI